MSRIGPYEVLGELGRGAMGVVYRARDEAAGREVALKLCLGRIDAARLARFKREAQLTASLDHPGIVRVHAAGEAQGRPWIAYELVLGESLEAALRQAPRPRRVELVRDVARALGHAHAQGIVHRDVKPANVLVDRAGRVRVTDFGLALAADLEQLTRTGAVVGTPAYMAPEQVGGDRGQLGPATDVWATGVMLYEALTGTLPFDGEGFLELAGQILQANVPAPSQRAPDVPPALEAVCLKALARLPAARYPDGEALAQDLDAALAGAGTVARPRRRRWPVVVALVAGGVGAAAWAAWPAETAPRALEPRSPTTPTTPATSATTTTPTTTPTTPTTTPTRTATGPTAAPGPTGWRARLEADAARPVGPRPALRLQHLDARLARGFTPWTQAAFLGDASVVTLGPDPAGPGRVRVWSLDAPHAPPREARATQLTDPFPELAARAPDLILALDNARLVQVQAAASVTWYEARRGEWLRGLAILSPVEAVIGRARGSLRETTGCEVVVVGPGRAPRVVASTTHAVVDLHVAGPLLAIVTEQFMRDPTDPGGGELLVVEHATGARALAQALETYGRAVALSGDGERVAVGLAGGFVRWMPVAGAPRMEDLRSEDGRFGGEATADGFAITTAMNGHVSGVRFAPDGRLWSTSFSETTPPFGELRAWDLAAGEELRALTRPAGGAREGRAAKREAGLELPSIISLELSADGRVVLLGTSAGEAQLWVVPR